MPFDSSQFTIEDLAEVEADSKRFDLVLEPEHARNLLECAEMLETDEHVIARFWFSNYDWIHEREDCGTIACAGGWYALRHHDGRINQAMAALGFPWELGVFNENISDARSFLFLPAEYREGSDATPNRVARRIRRFIALHSEQPA